MPNTISILGCGWLGLPLGAHLAASGYTVRGSTTQADKLERLQKHGIKPYLLDLDAPPKADVMADFFCSEVLFLNIPPRRKTPGVEARYARQMATVRRALETAPVQCVIFASSTSVYPNLNRTVTEGDADAPPTASGRALLAAEQAFLDAPRFATTVLRFAGLYGYDRKPGRFLAGRTDVANPDAPVNLLHRDDAVGVIQAVLAQEASDDVFNVCTDAHPDRKTFYTHAARALGLPPPQFREGPATDWKRISNAHLKARLGYTFQHPDPLQPAP